MAFWNKKDDAGNTLFDNISNVVGDANGLIDKAGNFKLPTLNVKADHKVDTGKMMPLVLLGGGLLIVAVFILKKRK